MEPLTWPGTAGTVMAPLTFAVAVVAVFAALVLGGVSLFARAPVLRADASGRLMRPRGARPGRPDPDGQAG